MSQMKESVLEFLPKNFEALYEICLELNDRGHILLLKDRVDVENSYIVMDKELLLSKISGTIFAPESFKEYEQLSTNTGVVPLSNIAECFQKKSKDLDLDIMIGFLTHLEFCHEITDQALLQLISKQCAQAPSEHYYLFPGLISVNADEAVWKSQSKYDCSFGWILKCSCPGQFFSSRFLQVLLLRLAFTLETSCENSNQNISLGIRQNCSLWKNGIFWGSPFIMQTLVEVTSDNKSVILLARFQKSNILQCVQHRSKVISTILQCMNEFCPRVLTSESFVDSAASPLQYPLNLDRNICTLQKLATAIVSDYVQPSVVIHCDPIPAENFLSFEPYLEMKLCTIQQLWNEKDEQKVITEKFLSAIAYQISEKLNIVVTQAILGNPSSSTRDDQLYQDLLIWRDGDMNNQKTYQDFRQIVDQYSVFAGRNVLELANLEGVLSLQPADVDQDNDRKQVATLIVKGNKPELAELQILEFSDGESLRIMERVAPWWKQMAISLGFSVARIKSIEISKHYQTDDASFEVFSYWLEGEHDLKAPTWEVLIQCLKRSNFLDLAEMLSNICTKDSNIHEQVEEQTEVLTNNNCEVLQRDHRDTFPSLDIKALEVIEGEGGRRVKIIDSIGSQWEELAKELKIEQKDIDIIKITHSDNYEEACRVMLTTWLQGNNGEVTWSTFIQSLNNAGLPKLANSLKEVLE